MTVRAKFILQSVTDYGGTGKRFHFMPQYDMNIPEDQRFARATPSGELTMFVDNPAVIERFKIGQAYYLDMVEAPYSVA